MTDVILMQDKFIVESRYGRTSGVRALAHYGLALLAMAEVEGNRGDSASKALYLSLSKRAQFVYDLIIQEIVNGYPSSNSVLFSLATSTPPDKGG